MDGVLVFTGIGGAIGVLVGAALLAPLFLIGRKNADPDADRLAATVPIYDRLDEATRRRLARQVTRFLKKKRITAATGKVPEIMRLAVAGNACMLRLGPGADCYPQLRDVCIDGASKPPARLGVDWTALQNAMSGGPHNPVVRACAALLAEAQSRGKSNQGAARHPQQWWQAFAARQAEIERAGSPLLAEDTGSFAAASEAYFQRGPALAQHHPALSELLREFFAVDTTTCA